MIATTTFAFANSAFVFETNFIPQGFLRRLEAEGTLTLGSRMADGAYVEPSVPLSQVLTRFALAGIQVREVRPSEMTVRGRRIVRSAAETHGRLRSPRAAEWLPTLPAA